MSENTTSTPAETQPDAAAPANIAPATDFSPSGAPRQVPPIDIEHPAVDNDPRKGTSVLQNRIDFNDPSLDSAAAVAENLRKQGVPVSEPAADAPQA